MLKELILEVFFPKKCIKCGKEGLYICKDCEIFLSEAPISKDVMAVWEYEGVIEKAIKKIKYDGQYHIIDELIEKALEKFEFNLPENTYITYVPMYKKKERQRGFNQAELIAKKIGEMTNRQVAPLLIKIKDNKSQTDLGPKERLENVKGVFASAPMMEIRPKSVLLVDDVYTTGATMKECEKILRKVGIKNIFKFILARRMSF